MAKTKKILSLFLVALMTVFTVLSYVPAKAATAPKLVVKAQPAATYTQKDTISFTVNANYAGKVMYRVMLYNGTTKTTSNLWNTPSTGYYYTKWTPVGTANFTIHWSASQLQPGFYSMTVLAKRVGSTAKYDTYVDTKSFEVKPAVDVVGDATKAVEDLETAAKADLTVQANLDDAQAKFAAAKDAVAKVEDATTKAALQARIDAVDAIVNYVNVTSVAATNASTIKVTFDKAVAPLTAKNFNIYEKDNTYAVQYVESVSVDKNVATLNMFYPLTAAENYVAQVSGVASLDGKLSLKEAATKEFTYTVPTPASIAFAATTVTTGDPVKVVIKDANGNDITSNYTSVEAGGKASYTDGTLVVESSSSVVTVDENKDVINTLGTGYSIVNAYIAGTTVKTGNTIIKVASTASAKLTSFGEFDLGKVNSTPVTSMYVSSGVKPFTAVTLDQNGNVIAAALTYMSSNPMVATIDAKTGLVTPVSVGTTNITVVAEQTDSQNNVIARIGKTITVTINAAPKAVTLKVDKASVKVVKGSNINATFTVSELDQYGNILPIAAPVVTLSQNGKYVTVIPAATENDDNSWTYTVSENTATTTAGYETVTFTDVNGLKATTTAGTVVGGDFAGFAVVPSATTLDLYANADHSQGPRNVTIHVYETDASGNYLKEISTDANVSYTVSDATILTQEAANTFTAVKTGTATVTVKVGTTTIAVPSFKVVDSTAALSVVTQNSDSISIATTDDLTKVLFGTFDETGNLTKAGVFTCKDQYGTIVAPKAADYTVLSTDVSVIYPMEINKTGNVTLVVKFANLDKVYMVNVFVK